MIKTVFLILVILVSGCKGVSQEKELALEDNTIRQEGIKVVKTEEEWRKQLSDLQYFVLREEGTERAFSSDLLEKKEAGVYACAGCGTPLFKSEHKFDSGTGWPSFDSEIRGNVAFDVDYKIGYERTEAHCTVCGGHLGHVFNDGPRETTGKRHCINGVALNFIPNQ